MGSLHSHQYGNLGMDGSYSIAIDLIAAFVGPLQGMSNALM